MQLENRLCSRFANDQLFQFEFSSSPFKKKYYLLVREKAASQDTKLRSQYCSRPVNSSTHLNFKSFIFHYIQNISGR